MDLSFSSGSEMKTLLGLLSITEELLFSIPLNSDLVEKYMTLRESGFKKIGISSNCSNLWEIQRQAHQELTQKHTSQEKQLKDVSDSLDLSRHSYKELYDISQKMLEFCREIALEVSKALNRSFFSKFHKEIPQLSLFSNYSQLNNTLNSDFNCIKDEVKSLVRDFNEAYTRETNKNYENQTQMVEINNQADKKIKELQKKIELLEEDSNKKYEKALIEGKKNYNKEIEDLKGTIKSQESKKAKEIEEIKQNYEKEIKFLEKEKNFALDSLSASLKSIHKQEIKDLESSFRAKESELLQELDMASNTDSSVLKTLRENLERVQVKVEDLREVLRAINERTESLYQKYAYREESVPEFLERKDEISRISDSKVWRQYSETLAQLDFMALSFKKLTSDNEWLVEQIDELSKENIDTQPKNPKEISFEQVLTTLSANETVIKDFQDARSKLLKQFADAKKTIA
jgi:hypothetical protein